jgi:hypothetical protein
MADALLKIEGIHKRFGGLHALNDVGLTINQNCIRMCIFCLIRRLGHYNTFQTRIMFSKPFNLLLLCILWCIATCCQNFNTLNV